MLLSVCSTVEVPTMQLKDESGARA